MAIFHIAYHGYRQQQSEEEFEHSAGMLNAYFATAPYIEDGAAGRYAGHPDDGFHDAAAILPSCSFHATDAPREQIPAIRAELSELYRQIEATDWVGVPSGAIQLMMLGDHQ